MRGVVMRMRMRVVELIRDCRYRWQVLKRREGGVSIGQTHARLAHTHSGMQVARQRGVAPVLTGALQDRSHAGHHRRAPVGNQAPVGSRRGSAVRGVHQVPRLRVRHGAVHVFHREFHRESRAKRAYFPRNDFKTNPSISKLVSPT